MFWIWCQNHVPIVGIQSTWTSFWWSYHPSIPAYTWRCMWTKLGKAVPQSNAVMFWTKLRKQGSCWEPDLIELSFQNSLIGTLRNVTWLCTCTKNPYHESPQSWISAVFKSYGQSLNEMFHSKPQVPSLDDLKKVFFANSVSGLIRNKIKQLENVQCIRPIGMWVTVSTCFNQLLTMAHKS